MSSTPELSRGGGGGVSRAQPLIWHIIQSAGSFSSSMGDCSLSNFQGIAGESSSC